MIRIVTDSTCDLPAEVIAKYDSRVVPLHISVGDKGYLDDIDIIPSLSAKTVLGWLIWTGTLAPV